MTTRIVVVGAGLAGAATACHLARLGGCDVVVCEAEKEAGRHASGAAAGMVRQVVASPRMAEFASRSAREYAERAGERGGLRFTPSGSLLLGRRSDLADLLASSGVPGATIMGPRDVHVEFDPIDPATELHAIATPTDGLIDVRSLLDHYLSEAERHGASVRYDSPVRDVRVAGGRVVGVETDTESLAADVVVNAAGAWAARLARLAGAEPLALSPRRRHVFVTAKDGSVDPGWPFVWDVETEWYARPDGHSLWLSACDETPCEPEDLAVDEEARRSLVSKLRERAPDLARMRLARTWAGLRTFASDGEFIIGWDRRLRGFLWVAGLGGHGVSASWAIGEEAARLFELGSSVTGEGCFAPSRATLRTP